MLISIDTASRVPQNSDVAEAPDLHDLQSDEDGGDGDGCLPQEQDEVADAVDGGHAQGVPGHDAERLLRRLAEAVAVDCCRGRRVGCGCRWYCSSIDPMKVCVYLKGSCQNSKVIAEWFKTTIN